MSKALLTAAMAAVALDEHGQIVGGYEPAWRGFAAVHNLPDQRAREIVARAARRLRHEMRPYLTDADGPAAADGRAANGAPPGGNPGAGRDPLGEDVKQFSVRLDAPRREWLNGWRGDERSQAQAIRDLIDNARGATTLLVVPLTDEQAAWLQRAAAASNTTAPALLAGLLDGAAALEAWVHDRSDSEP